MLAVQPTPAIVTGTDITATFTVPLSPAIAMWYLPRHLFTQKQIIYRATRQIQLLTSFENPSLNSVAKSQLDLKLSALLYVPKHDSLPLLNVPVRKTIRTDEILKKSHHNNVQKSKNEKKIETRSQRLREMNLEELAKPKTVIVLDNENITDADFMNSDPTMVKSREQFPLQRFHLLHTSNIPNLLWNEMSDHQIMSAPDEGVETKKDIDDSIENIHYQATLLKAPKVLHQKNISPLNTLNSLMKPKATKPLQLQLQNNFEFVQKDKYPNGQMHSEENIAFSDLLSEEHKSIRSTVTELPDTGLNNTTLSTKEFVVTY